MTTITLVGAGTSMGSINSNSSGCRRRRRRRHRRRSCCATTTTTINQWRTRRLRQSCSRRLVASMIVVTVASTTASSTGAGSSAGGRNSQYTSSNEQWNDSSNNSNNQNRQPYASQDQTEYPPPADEWVWPNENEEYATTDAGSFNTEGQYPPPPPPPRPPYLADQQEQQQFQQRQEQFHSSSSWSNERRLPIHYNFPAAPATLDTDENGTNTTASRNDANGSTGNALVPIRPLNQAKFSSRQDPTRYASARQDTVTKFMTQSLRNRLLVAASAMTIGYGGGTFVGRSMFGPSSLTSTLATALAVLCGFGTLLRNNPYGEWIRAMGLLLILTIQRSHRIRQRYPSWRYIVPHRFLPNNGIGRRGRGGGPIPFPPIANPWAWENDTSDSDNRNGNAIEFYMLYSVVAMAVMGATLGAQVPNLVWVLRPLLPSSLTALVGAAMAAYMTTLRPPSPYGSLFRCMGMRVVAMVRDNVQLVQSPDELDLVAKTTTVASKLLDTMLILDRQHRIKDKIVQLLSWLVALVSRVQQDATTSRNEASTKTSTPLSSRGPRTPPVQRPVDDFTDQRASRRTEGGGGSKRDDPLDNRDIDQGRPYRRRPSPDDRDYELRRSSEWDEPERRSPPNNNAFNDSPRQNRERHRNAWDDDGDHESLPVVGDDRYLDESDRHDGQGPNRPRPQGNEPPQPKKKGWFF